MKTYPEVGIIWVVDNSKLLYSSPKIRNIGIAMKGMKGLKKVESKRIKACIIHTRTESLVGPRGFRRGD